MHWYVAVLKKYAVFSGRARPREYWMFGLVHVIIMFILASVAETVYIVYCFAVLIPGTAVGVRRMHDIGRSGWWLLCPIVNIVFVCLLGEKGDNRFGPDPVEGSRTI